MPNVGKLRPWHIWKTLRFRMKDVLFKKQQKLTKNKIRTMLIRQKMKDMYMKIIYDAYTLPPKKNN